MCFNIFRFCFLFLFSLLILNKSVSSLTISGKWKLSGQCNTSSDYNPHYKFTSTSAGGNVTITLRASGGSIKNERDPFLFLLDGSVIVQSNDNGGNTSTSTTTDDFDAKITYNTAPNKIYTIIAATAQEFTVGDFTLSITGAVKNVHPIVDAGPDKYPIINSNFQVIELSGTATPVSGQITNTQWRQLSGPEVTINSASTLNASFLARPNKEYSFELTVSDGINSSTDTVKINAKSPHSVKIAYIQWGIGQSLPTEFLQKAKKLGYTHIQMEFWLILPPFSYDWDGNGNMTGNNTKNQFKALFEQVDSYGLKLIPSFETGNAHSVIHLVNSQIPASCQIPHNLFPGEKKYNIPPANPHDVNVNKVIEQIIKAIVDGFNAAKPQLDPSRRDLDFISLGMDENWVASHWDSINNIATFAFGAGLCESDRKWIQNYAPNDPADVQISKLMAASITRRIGQVKHITERNNLNTRILIWADCFDPEYENWTNVITVNNFFNPTSTVPLQASKSLEYISPYFRKDLVLMPWNYGAIPFYNPNNTFSFFSNLNYNFIFTTAGYGCVADTLGVCSLKYNKPFGNNSTLSRHTEALTKYAKSAVKYRSNWLGSSCTNWVGLGFGYYYYNWTWDESQDYLKPFEWMPVHLSTINTIMNKSMIPLILLLE